MSSTTTATILVAEEEEMTRSFLYENLSADGYQVLVAQDQIKALALLSTAQADLVLLDLNGDTLSLVDALRCGEGIAGRADPDTPVIALGRDADRLQRIRLLDRGSDDVVKKPFAYPELRARIAAVLRRSRARRSARVVRVGPLQIDTAGRDVRIGEDRLKLSAKKYELLVALASDPHRVFTREELLRSVWGFRSMGRTRTLDSHASRLRRKLVDENGQRLVVNVWGVGYRLCDPPGAR